MTRSQQQGISFLSGPQGLLLASHIRAFLRGVFSRYPNLRAIAGLHSLAPSPAPHRDSRDAGLRTLQVTRTVGVRGSFFFQSGLIED